MGCSKGTIDPLLCEQKELRIVAKSIDRMVASSAPSSGGRPLGSWICTFIVL